MQTVGVRGGKDDDGPAGCVGSGYVGWIAGGFSSVCGVPAGWLFEDAVSNMPLRLTKVHIPRMSGAFGLISHEKGTDAPHAWCIQADQS